MMASMSCAIGAAAADPPEAFAGSRRSLQAVVSSGRIPAVAVAVTAHGRIVWEEAFGVADRERGRRATVDTPFYMASITKSLTATSLSILVRQGLLRFDDPVNWYLDGPGVHSPMWSVDAATIRRLASHTAGLTTFTHWCEAGDRGCSTDVAREIRDYGILFWPPGEIFEYSNLGYGILGKAIADVTGEPFGRLMTRQVFEPLQMTHCFVEGESRPGLAAAQYDQRTHRRSPERVSGHAAASGAYCSAHDLALFGMFHLEDHLASQRQILTDDEIQQMHVPQPATRGQYGIGWWIRNQDGERVVSAQGGTTDAYALLALVPSRDIAVVVLANSFDQAIVGVGDDLIRAALHQPSPPHSVEAAPAAPLAHGELVGTWTGTIETHRGSVPLRMTIDRSGQARGALGPHAPVPLRDVRVRANHVYGRFPTSTRGLPDSNVGPQILELDLFLREDRLIGAATTGPPEGKGGDQLPHWTVLTRAR